MKSGYILKKIIFILSIILIKYSVVSYGQDSEKPDRTLSPVLQSPRIISLPKIIEKHLENGLPVYFIEKHDQPLVSLELVIKGGSYFDNKMSGLASITSEMLTKGTKTRTAKAVAEQIEFYGSVIYSDADFDACEIRLESLKKYFYESLEIFNDCLQNPKFSEQEISSCVNRRIDQVAQLKTDPEYLTEIVLSKAIFRDHPYATPSFGEEKSLKNIRKSNILRYYKKYFTVNNSFLIIAGDISAEEIIPELEKLFGTWKSGKPIDYEKNNKPSPDIAQVIIIDRPGAVQSSIKMGFQGVEKKNQNIPSLNIINTYLGGYFRCQLIANLREKNGFAYDAGSWFDARKFPGPFFISTQVGTDVTSEAIQEIFIEIDSIRNKLISSSRLNEVRNVIIGSFPVNLQNNSQLVKLFSKIKLYDLPDNYYDSLLSSIAETSSEDILKVSKEFFDNRKFNIVVSGDAEKIKDNLVKFGSIKIIKENTRF